MCGRSVARAWGAPSRDARQGMLRCDAKRTLDCLCPRRGTAIHMRDRRDARDTAQRRYSGPTGCWLACSKSLSILAAMMKSFSCRPSIQS
jgi:hypothetical protein